MAPEMYNKGSYTRLVDMWSIGVIFYRLLSQGKIPFQPDELRSLAEDTSSSVDYAFSGLQYSSKCMHLLVALLQPDVCKRCPHYVAVDHPFLTGENKEPALMLYEFEARYETKRRLRQILRFLQLKSFFEKLLPKSSLVDEASSENLCSKKELKVGQKAKPDKEGVRRGHDQLQSSHLEKKVGNNHLKIPRTRRDKEPLTPTGVGRRGEKGIRKSASCSKSLQAALAKKNRA